MLAFDDAQQRAGDQSRRNTRATFGPDIHGESELGANRVEVFDDLIQTLDVLDLFPRYAARMPIRGIHPMFERDRITSDERMQRPISSDQQKCEFARLAGGIEITTQ